MKRVLKLMLGVMTAIGGFVDIGNLVTSGVTGSRFGTSLTWAVVLGTVAMVVYGEMAGRIAAVAHRSVFHLVRERLGVRLGMVNLVGSFALNLLTVAAEIGGVALAIQLVSDVNYLLWVPLVGLLAWVVIWRAPFAVMDNVIGMLGLTLLVFLTALFTLHAHWGDLTHAAVHPTVPSSETHLVWWFYAISLYGACVVPYQAYRQIVDVDGVAVGKVDDLELELHQDGAPTIAALLCGPMALGPRLGGRLGVWYSAIAHRLHPRARPEPVRFDIDRVIVFDPRELRLDPGGRGSDGDRFALRTWTREKIITRLQGGSR